jgi:hypothetical protein
MRSIPSWPPPVNVRRILRVARHRLHARPPFERPADVRDIFTVSETRELILSGAYPLSPRALAWLVEPPVVRGSRRRRWRRRVEAVVRRLLAAELPEAVALLMGRAGQ